MPLHSLDILILLALAIGIIRGFITGAIRQVVTLIGTVLAIILAVELMNPVGSAVGAIVGLSERFYPVAGLLAVFLVVQIAVLFAARALEGLIKAIKLNTVNRAAGAIVGLGKAALLVSIMFVVLAFFDVPEEDKRKASLLYHDVAGVLPTAWDYVSEQIPKVKSMSDRMGREARAVLED